MLYLDGSDFNPQRGDRGADGIGFAILLISITCLFALAGIIHVQQRDTECAERGGVLVKGPYGPLSLRCVKVAP